MFDVLFYGCLSGFTLNSYYAYERSQKRHLLEIIGIKSISYYFAYFLVGFSLLLIYNLSSLINYLFLEDFREISLFNQFYIVPRVVISFTLVPQIFLLAYFLKNSNNAEHYTTFFIYIFSFGLVYIFKEYFDSVK